MKQQDLIRRLSLGEGFGGVAPERIDTHISTIFLIGDDAYKLKHALRTSYLDYSTLADRHRLCEAELEINRRTAPRIYLDAVPVRRTDDDTLILGEGPGEPVEWLVHMRRFEQQDLFDKLAEEDRLTPALLTDLADEIAVFHSAVEIVEDSGAEQRIGGVVDQTVAELRKKGAGIIDPGLTDRFEQGCRTAFAKLGDILNRRGGKGYVRRCHGDLHLRNICLIDGKPTLFDAIEFSEDIGKIDVLFDLAFLIMDLLQRDMGYEANLVFNRYLYRTDDIADLSVFPLFQAIRAGTRAHVCAMDAAGRDDPDTRQRLRLDAGSYLRLGLRQFAHPAPVLVAIGGLSGTGKSTIAREIAPRLGPLPGALVVSSDLVRKRLMGVEPLTRLTDTAYNPETDRAVYRDLSGSAEKALASGYSVVLDATFIDSDRRDELATVAEQAGVRFEGFWLETDDGVLRRRLRQRVGDPSDATAAILQHQHEKNAGEIHWHRIDATRPSDESSSAVLGVLKDGMVQDDS